MYPTHCVKLAEHVRILADAPQSLVTEMLTCRAGGVSRKRQSMRAAAAAAALPALPALPAKAKARSRFIFVPILCMRYL